MDEDKKRYAAIASIVLGFLNIIIGICIPPCGGVLVLGGIALGILGVRSESKVIGWVGIGVNMFALLFVIAAQTFNIMLATGQIQVQDIIDQVRPPAADAGAADGGVDGEVPLMPWPDDVGAP